MTHLNFTLLRNFSLREKEHNKGLEDSSTKNPKSATATSLNPNITVAMGRWGYEVYKDWKSSQKKGRKDE